MKIIALIIATTLSACSIFNRYRTFENIDYLYKTTDSKALQQADNFRDSTIRQQSIRQRITSEFVVNHVCGYTVAYRVENSRNIEEGNFIFINLTEEKEIDLENTHISEEALSEHIHDPENFRLGVSATEFKEMINREEFEAGVREWTFGLVVKGSVYSHMNWLVSNTLSLNKGPGRGRVMHVNVMTREISYTDWTVVNN
jgi:hypothetical protein